MSNRRQRATVWWRGFSAVLVLAVIMVLLGEMAGSAAAAVAPQPKVAAAPASMPMSVNTPADDDDDFDRQLVEDIAAHANDPEVRAAAQAALDSHDPAQIEYFLDHGEADAKARAAARKAREAAHNRELVQGWAQTGGPKVRAAAQAALNAGDDQSLADFVLYGHEIADKQDQQDQIDAKAEQDRITGRVTDMVARGGPQVKVEGQAALASNDYDKIKAFYLTGYADANKRDHDFQAVIEKALADRNKAVTDLEDLANRTAAAANARAEILRANIEAVQALDNATLAMKQAASFAHRADEIVQEDKPAHEHGQPGRTADIDSLRAQATQQAEAAARASQSARGTTAVVQTAAVELVHSGMTNGLDWAKITIAVGAAVEACSQAALTAQHAAEAALADSRALDADNKAEQHAENAKKWRAEAERQAQSAADLAAAAKQQQDIAIGARDRAKAQEIAAETAAAQARQHAANARAARINAQGAASNAVAKSNAAVAAHNAAMQDGVREQNARDAALKTTTDLQTATTMCLGRQTLADQIEGALKAARDQATREGKDADAATKDIAADAQRARAAANDSAAWADRARAAAATAQAEAAKAAAAAQRSRAAAAAADQEAQTARRAADDANQLAMQAASVAQSSQAAADQTRYEAEGAVSESNQAVFQAQVADRAADAASASASMVINPAQMADVIAKPYADINGDARQAMAASVEAIRLSEALAKSARDRATEADQAADRAKKAADDAVAEVKPAYDAAARAAQSALQAAQYASNAVDAANAAAGYAHNANVAATDATRSASAAGVDASAAGRAATMATNAAYIAGQAADAAAKIQAWAETVTNAIHGLDTSITAALNQFQDEKAKAAAAEKMAQEQADKKQKDLNDQFSTFLHCYLSIGTGSGCKDFDENVAQAVADGLLASAQYVKDDFRCLAGDQAACDRTHATHDKIWKFITGSAQGFADAAVSFGNGLKTIGGCFIETVKLDPGSDCATIRAGFQDMIDNPYKIVHLDVWQSDPANAFGQTAFDVFTVVVTLPIGGTGSILGKVVETVSNMISKATTRIVGGLGKIADLTMDVIDRTTGLSLGTASVQDMTITVLGGTAKLDGAYAAINGATYKVESLTVKIDGDLSKLEGSVGRLTGGVLKFDSAGVARIENATFEIEPLKPGETLPVAASETGTNLADGSWVGEELGKKLTLPAVANSRANDLLKLAAERESAISPKIVQLAKDIPDAVLEGWKFRLKGELSLKRKLIGDLEGDYSTARMDEVFGKLRDTIRYTLVVPENGYVDFVKQAVAKLKADKFTLNDVKNFWAKNPKEKEYRGINLTMGDPGSGLQFEFQVHTEASFFAKQLEHPWFEVKRTPGATAEEIEEAKEMSKLLFGDVPFPDGAEALTPDMLNKI
jgi:hypothetical protein